MQNLRHSWLILATLQAFEVGLFWLKNGQGSGSGFFLKFYGVTSFWVQKCVCVCETSCDDRRRNHVKRLRNEYYFDVVHTNIIWRTKRAMRCL